MANTPTPAIASPAANGGDNAAKISPEMQMRLARLDNFGQSLTTKRTEAVQARESSGIEQQWLEDQEFYEGIDEANRHEFASAWRTKPPGQTQVQSTTSTRSTVFVNITGPYCDIAAARFADMVLPSDEPNFKIEPPPNPDLTKLAKGELTAKLQSQVQAEGQQAQQQVDQAVAQAKLIVDTAIEKAGKAQKRIETWHIEGQWHAEVRRTIEDAARKGSGVLKGPFPFKMKSIAWVMQELEIIEKITPKSRRIDCWDFYPHGGCGDNIHNGSYTWERDRLTRRQLEDLKGTMVQGPDGQPRPLYIDAQIDRCLREGPQAPLGNQKKTPDNRQNQGSSDIAHRPFEIWYFHGVADREDLIAAGCDCTEDKVGGMPAIVTMVNGHVISGTLNPLDTGDFPYDVMPWRRKDGQPWGDGIARQIRTAQRIVNAGVRNMMDNGGLSAGCQIVFKPGTLVPQDGLYAITPNKIWILGEDGDIDDVRKALAFFEVPSRQKELMAIVQFGLKIAEDTTGIPMLLQGQQGTAPDTVGGMTMLNNNANSSIRRIARTFDDCVTEPHVRREYAWLMQHGEDDSEKGTFVINARASSALVERDMQNQNIQHLLPASLNPAYGIDPKKTMAEQLKAWRFDPANFEFTDDEWKQVVASLSQKPQDQRLAVAQLKAKMDERLLLLEQHFEREEAEKENQVKLLIAAVSERIEGMRVNGQKEMSFEELKAMLADTSMKLATQREISAANLSVDIHKHHNPPPVLPAPTEPAGRAKPGQAFSA